MANLGLAITSSHQKKLSTYNHEFGQIGYLGYLNVQL